MKKFFAVALLFFSVTTVRAQDPAARMDQIVAFYAQRQFMGSVLAARDGEVIFEKSYGSADLEWDVPNTSTTKFRIGSVTKQFTAASILLLEERGKLKTDDLVKKYMPDAPTAWDKITIYHVLTHTSGIPSFTSFPDYNSTKTVASPVEKTLQRFHDKPLDFQPGEKWSYSNSGYILLGYLIEKISGQSYEKFLQDNIFTPLGMNDSGYDSHAAVIAHRASGYTPRGDTRVNADYIDMTIPFSAGGLYSTTGDLLRWEQGLFGGKVLSADSLKKMTTPFLHDYACGLGVRVVGVRKVIDHGGGIEGFNTHLAYYPEDKLVIVVLSNLNGAAPAPIASNLGAVAHGDKVVLPSERKEVSIPRSILESYVGTYELRPGFDLKVTLEDGQLMTQATRQPKVPIFAESETKFFLKVLDAQIVFVKNEQGAVTHLILFQNGQEIRSPRKP